jgi:glutathionyl-hydroquinone reductase
METIIIHNKAELKELIQDNQTSIYNVLNNRAYVKGIGHTTVMFSKEIKDILLKLTVEVIGGNKSTSVRRFLANGQYRHYTLERMFIECYDNIISVNYCAGQDYRAEMQDLRRFIYTVA